MSAAHTRSAKATFFRATLTTQTKKLQAAELAKAAKAICQKDIRKLIAQCHVQALSMVGPMA